MKLEIKVIAIALASGLLAFFLTPILWPISPSLGEPTLNQQFPLQFLTFLEALLFGFGIAFLFLGFKYVKRNNGMPTGIYISISWLLLSWWPHDRLHLATGINFSTQLYLEYAFHIPSMLAILYLAYYYLYQLATNI